MEIILKKEHKKCAILSYGPRISLDQVNVRAVDLIYLREYLINSLGRECDFVSKKSYKDKYRDYYKDIRQTDLNEYDEVFIYNSALNFFGGAVDIGTLETIKRLNIFKGDIYYMMADPKMPCVDITYELIKRFKKNDGKLKTGPDKWYNDIKLEDFEYFSNNVWPNIKCAFQGENYELYYEQYNAKEYAHKTLSCKDWCKLPLSDYYAVNENLEEKLKQYDVERPYDLIYFGNNRCSSRNNVIADLYDIEGNNNLIVGYDPEFKNCKYESREYVSHDVLFEMISTSAYATVILGDELHNNNMRSARFFESMLLDIVAFIWKGYDENKMFVKNEELKDFIYVSTAEELREKVNKIKNDHDFFRHIIELERKDILEQFGHYKHEITTEYFINNEEEQENAESNTSVELF